jgi:hypothetical protein
MKFAIAVAKHAGQIHVREQILVTLRAFLVLCGFAHWPACEKFQATDDKQFRVSVFYGLCDSINNL